jgi:hypothetical protein
VEVFDLFVIQNQQQTRKQINNKNVSTSTLIRSTIYTAAANKPNKPSCNARRRSRRTSYRCRRTERRKGDNKTRHDTKRRRRRRNNNEYVFQIFEDVEVEVMIHWSMIQRNRNNSRDTIWRTPSGTGFFWMCRSRCGCYTCNYSYSAIPRVRKILKKLLRIESHHHDNGNVSDWTSMDTGLFNTNLLDEI